MRGGKFEQSSLEFGIKVLIPCKRAHLSLVLNTARRDVDNHHCAVHVFFSESRRRATLIKILLEEFHHNRKLPEQAYCPAQALVPLFSHHEVKE